MDVITGCSTHHPVRSASFHIKDANKTMRHISVESRPTETSRCYLVNILKPLALFLLFSKSHLQFIQFCFYVLKMYFAGKGVKL